MFKSNTLTIQHDFNRVKFLFPMKYVKYLAAAFVIIHASCSDNSTNGTKNLEISNNKTINTRELNNIPVIGILGVPLGDPIEIKAVVIDGEKMKDKIHSSSYLLKVTHVNGSKVTPAAIMEFSLAHAKDVRLANDNFDLYEMIHGKEIEVLTGSQISKLKINYVGKELSLLVYETGSFGGMPHNLPDEAFLWQDEGFGFVSRLEVLLERPVSDPIDVE